jgi:acyl-CoA thioesterase FadM
MARLKMQLPESFHFSCSIPIRITDINYGGHVGNDTVLSLIHEARMQFLYSIGYSEMNFGGSGMIMADVTIEFKSEIFYGDTIIAHVTAGEISKIGFELFYKLETYRNQQDSNMLLIANAKTSMICYNYEKKKIVAIPEEAKAKLINKG